MKYNHPTVEKVNNINKGLLIRQLKEQLLRTKITCLWIGQGLPVIISMPSNIDRLSPNFFCSVKVLDPIKNGK